MNAISPVANPTDSAWQRWCLGWPAAAVLLGGFWVMGVTAWSGKSMTYDEMVHITGGTSYWLANDYRIHSENGNLPQRWAALPICLSAPVQRAADWANDVGLPISVRLPQFRFPSHDEGFWHTANDWAVGQHFFHYLDNDVDAMLLSARAMICAAALVMGVLVWRWSRRLFGAAGGMISLILFCFSPTFLAHGAIATSDLFSALFMLASIGALWALMHRISLLTLVGGGLVIGGLALSKMSVVLVVPMGLILLGVRLLSSQPLAFAIGPWRGLIRGRALRIASLVGAVVIQMAIVVLLIWTAFGFRFSMFDDPQPGLNVMLEPMEQMLDYEGVTRDVIAYTLDHRLLPEGYLYGMAHTFKHAIERPGFLAGELSLSGFRMFFPVAFAIKTPLTLMVLLVLALIAAMRVWRRDKRGATTGNWPFVARAFYRTAPLWALLIVYWPVAIMSHMNIGHRHLLPTYPVLFVLAGAAGAWVVLRPLAIRRVLMLVVGLFVAESIVTWPDYLAYFNQLIGGPRYGYRYLADSSLDWGQDLPGFKRWLDMRREETPNFGPVYLSYFGAGNPLYYGIDDEAGVRRLPPYIGLDEDRFLEPLEPGVYCISATQIHGIYTDARGSWELGLHEKHYQSEKIMSVLRDADAAGWDRRQRYALLHQQYADEWIEKSQALDSFRMHRLSRYLLQREPEELINYSILVYYVGTEELNRAVWQPMIQGIDDPILPR